MFENQHLVHYTASTDEELLLLSS